MSRECRAIDKAEITGGKRNPRYIVTNLSSKEDWVQSNAAFGDVQALYEDI